MAAHTIQYSSSKLTWHIPEKVLLLTLPEEYTLKDAKTINQRIIDELNKSQSSISILIDAEQMSRPYNFSDIRAVQTYMDHDKLKHIYVVANDRIVKLAMMVIFNLSRASFHVFDDLENATSMLQRHLINVR